MMLENYLKTAFRNARKHSLYTLINILGLTLALTGALFLLLYRPFLNQWKNFKAAQRNPVDALRYE